MLEVTKTLELYLVNPNTHKERKLRETRDAYQQALQAAFDADCTTQSAANDVVVAYELSGYAKNAHGDSLWERIDHIIHRVSRQVVERAQQVDNPVLVLENLRYIRENLDYDAFMNRRLHGWAFAKLHAQIQYKAEEAGIPVATVNPRNTSKECHVCGETGTRPQQATFRCTNDECWVGEYQADVNAALNIADRYRSGESQPKTDRDSGQKTAGDDSATDGPH